ncbi:hypothetical protein [Xenorhabdus bovienii]|nr:hypothetical protein [Xenorhabdus bovienii]MDE1492516.1 helix-turn-helix domain-containing protein [Xenorhabdus bovienii]
MNTTEDWHSSEVIAALRKIGTSITEFSREFCEHRGTLSYLNYQAILSF